MPGRYMTRLILILSLLMWALTLFGLYRPWLALWWSDYCTRIKVLQIYGSAAAVLSVIYVLIK